ncbi:MAG: TRAP transporter permease [Sphaerochaetaceae bacterium]|nr:TRAP transporter permease [Sphaerochaetaceae bacterium]
MDTKKHTKAGSAAADSANDILRKYDKESATRLWSGLPKTLVSVVTAIFSLYCIWSTLFSTADIPVRLTAFLGFSVIMGFLTYPASKKHVRENFVPWYDILIMAVGAFCFFYYCLNYNSLVMTITSASKINPASESALPNAVFYLAIGIIAILVMAELCRRCVGLPILFVVGALLVYTFASGQNLSRVIYTMFFGTSGLMSTPLQVCAKFIAIFIIFGAFLERTGVANFFIDLANSLVGWASGGPAKVAVISSALCGMVSGSSVGNTVTTGSVTIPMMKETGYKGEFAGAVEAAASTGGQIMPPIMGAAAFLMSEYMGEPYMKVALWAILPAVLYFAGIFISVHLEAKKLGLKGISRDQLPKFKVLLKDIYLLLPLIILVYLVAGNIKSLAYSATIAIAVAILVAIPGHIKKEKTPVKVAKKTGLMILDSLAAGGRSCITVIVACSMAGMVAGCITVTGLASRLIGAIVSISQSIPNPALGLLIALFLTMLSCIVLGMGVPTTANYCIMASTTAPILITLGIPRVAAHFFVFYFGIVADITPPVALAAYAGSAIAKADPMKTGLNATKLAIAAFIVPYVFCFNPSMLLMDQGVFSAIQGIISALLGLFGVSMALEGFFKAKLPAWQRVLSCVAGLMLIFPGTVTDIVGVAGIGLVILLNSLNKKTQAVA